MSHLSIIIPLVLRNAVEAFEETLASVLERKPEDTELIVVDQIGYGDPWNIRSEGVRFLTFDHEPNMTVMANEAIRATQGEIVHLLFPGAQVAENWTCSVLDSFEPDQIACVLPRLMNAERTRKVYSIGCFYRSNGDLQEFKSTKSLKGTILGIAPNIGAAFLRKSAWKHVGELDSSYSLQISYMDLALRMEMLGYETVIDPKTMISVFPKLLPHIPPFVWGTQCEILYRRWSRLLEPNSSQAHWAMVRKEFWKNFPSLSAIYDFWGRYSASGKKYAPPQLEPDRYIRESCFFHESGNCTEFTEQLDRKVA